MKNREKKIVALIFLVFIGFMFFGIPGKYAYEKIKPHFAQNDVVQESADQRTIAKETENQEAATQDLAVQEADSDPGKVFNTDWEKLYPFEDPEKNIKPENTSATDDNSKSDDSSGHGDNNLLNKAVNKYQEFCGNITGHIENGVIGYSLLTNESIYMYGKINHIIGNKFIKDSETTTADIGNGYLSFLSSSNGKNDVAIHNTIEFSKWLKVRGTDFMFVSAPSKVVDKQHKITGINESNAPLKQNLCDSLSENGISVLNISDYMPGNYDEYMSRFYRTDHHWKTETGLWAAGLIAEKLNKEHGFNINRSLLNPDRYTVKNYPELFLGSQGKKVGLGYAKPDDFSLIIPEYYNHIHVFMPHTGINNYGDFTTLIDKTQINGEDVYNKNPYGAYSYGDQPLTQVTNASAVCSKRILIIKDSFSDAVIPFLAMTCRKVDAIDLRGTETMNCFSGSLKTYLNKNHYDVVIDLTNDTGCGDERTINNTGSIWYFE